MREPTAEHEEDEEMSQWTQKKHQECRAQTETPENVSLKKRVMMKSLKRPATPVSPPDDPVKRRLLKKTDLQSSGVLMAVEIKDTDLLHTMDTLLNDETGEEEEPWSEEVQKMKILSALDAYEEMMKGRQNELNSLKEMGAMIAVKRSEATGKRVSQHDGSIERESRSREVQASSEGLQSMSAAYSARDVLTNTIDTVPENNVGCKFT